MTIEIESISKIGAFAEKDYEIEIQLKDCIFHLKLITMELR